MSLPMRVRVSSTMGTAGALPPTSRSHDVYSRSPVAGQEGVPHEMACERVVTCASPQRRLSACHPDV